jgi:uncharacterized protein (TIRG00374 family)
MEECGYMPGSDIRGTPPPASLQTRRVLIGFGLITLLYVGALTWIDAKGQVFGLLPLLLSALPVLALVSLLTYLVRFARWHWLLVRAGWRVPVKEGLLAYLAGFALTATPGKAGELIRIRYFSRLGVPPARVVAAFLFERAWDLVVVLLLAAVFMQRADLLFAILLFTFGVIGTLILLVFWSTPANLGVRMLQKLGWPRLARLTAVLRAALQDIRVWMNPRDILVMLIFGGVAWGATSFAFVYLLGHLGIFLPGLHGAGIYPLSMMAGAVSMLPGGLGSTEVTIVGLLQAEGVAASLAVLAAVGIRLGTLWFAILCGFAAMVASEALMKSQPA